MKIYASYKVVYDPRPPEIAVDTIEDIACGLHRQCEDFRTLAMSGDCRDAGGDQEAHRPELAQFVHHRIDLLGLRSLGVENRLGIVEDYQHFLGGKKGLQSFQAFGVFDPCTDDLGNPGKEMCARSWKLIATDESTVLAKSFLDPMVVEDSESDRCFPNPPRTDESDGFEVLGKSDDVPNQLIASKAGPWGWGW